MTSPKAAGATKRNLAVFFCAAVLVAGLGACQQTGPSAEIRKDYSHVEINRIGDLRSTDAELQDRAIKNALAHLEAQNIPRDKITRVVIQSQDNPGSPLIKSFIRPLSFRLWLDYEGCDTNIMYTASVAGTLTSVTDDGQCLGGKGTF